MERVTDKNKIAAAKAIGKKHSGFLLWIGLFSAMWAILLAISIYLVIGANGIFALLIAVSAIFLLRCLWEALNYLLTPAECVKLDGDKLLFWCNRKWLCLGLDEIDELSTNSPTGTFTTMRTILDRGVLRIFDRKNTLYRIKYLEEPAEVKKKIDEIIAAADKNAVVDSDKKTNTDNSDNTIDTI